MKITKQIIAAAGFAALFFAPLSQAQTTFTLDDLRVGSVKFRVRPAGVSISEASAIDFGRVTPHTETADILEMTCSEDSDVGITSTTADAAEPSGAATCGVITVEGGISPTTSYMLRVGVTAFTTEDGMHTISPSLDVYENGQSSPILADVEPNTAVDARTFDGGSIDARGSATFTVGGSMPIAGRQVAGDYTGNYTIEVVSI